VEEQGRLLWERVREIEQQRTDRAAEVRLLEGVETFCTSVRGALHAPSFEVQQKVLQLVVDRIVVEDSRVIIEHVVPTGPVRLQTEHPAAANPACADVSWNQRRPSLEDDASGTISLLQRCWAMYCSRG
jgi:hypothetical protein